MSVPPPTCRSRACQRHAPTSAVGLAPSCFTALLIGHWIPVWLIGVGAALALPLWLAAARYMAFAGLTVLAAASRYGPISPPTR